MEENAFIDWKSMSGGPTEHLEVKNENKIWKERLLTEFNKYLVPCEYVTLAVRVFSIANEISLGKRVSYLRNFLDMVDTKFKS